MLKPNGMIRFLINTMENKKGASQPLLREIQLNRWFPNKLSPELVLQNVAYSTKEVTKSLVRAGFEIVEVELKLENNQKLEEYVYRNEVNLYETIFRAW